MLDDLVAGVRAGDRGALARALSVVEDDPGTALVARLADAEGRAHVVGVTGPPGAGKSTLVAAMVAEWRGRGRSVGVLAVDPTSPLSGGAVLGDRIRMGAHVGDPGVFIRSMAQRGGSGGLAAATRQAVRILDAAGFDVVIVETLGAGQDEVAVARLAHTTVVLSVPGMGDAVQSLKAGILELADVHVVNKADLPGAAAEAALLETVAGHGRDGWRPPVLQTVAAEGRGVSAVVDAVEAHAAWRVSRASRPGDSGADDASP